MENQVAVFDLALANEHHVIDSAIVSRIIQAQPSNQRFRRSRPEFERVWDVMRET